MKRKVQRAPDDPGITRLAPRRSYRLDNPQDVADLIRHLEEWTPQWNEAKAWTFDGRVAPVEELARRLAPEWESPAAMLLKHRAGTLRGRKSPADGTVAWIAEKILNKLHIAHRPNGDVSTIAAFEAGQWYGHLLTKLGWESDALRGERALENAREAGRLGGRAPLVDVSDDLRAVVEARGAERANRAAALAAVAGVKPESILRAARRHRKHSRSR